MRDRWILHDEIHHAMSGLKSPAKRFRHFRYGERNGIAFCAAGVSRLLDQGGDVIFSHSVSSQPTDLQSRTEPGHPGDTIDGGCAVRAGNDSGNFSVAMKRWMIRGAFSQSLDIDLHHVGKKSSADCAVRRRELPAQWPGKSVDRPQGRIGKGEAAEQAAQRHIAAAAGIITLLKNPLKHWSD